MTATNSRTTLIATATASGMIAQQVSGKAIRDALFLSTFAVELLPRMMAGAAIASLVAVIAVSRLLARRSPAGVLPFLFGANFLAIGAGWLLFFAAPKVAAIVVYLSFAILGPVVMSAFWSLVNETFDPHTAKTAVTRIASGATLGGVLGGMVAWWLSRQHTLSAAIAFLSALNLACAIGAVALARGGASREPLDAPQEEELPSPIRILRDRRFLRSLAALVALGSASSTLLDYTFNAKATLDFGSGPALLAFFSLFGLAVSVLSFLVQLAFGRAAIERLGLGGNVAALQVLVIGGCTLGLLVPGMPSLTILRGTETIHRNTLFKSAYELFYTPIPEARKRITKAVIDVGFDRLGTVLGSAITLVVLWRSHHEEIRLLWVVAWIALLSLAIVKWLHSGYVETLAEDLREAPAPSAEPAPVSLIERIEAVRHPEDRHGTARLLRERRDDLARRAVGLTSDDPTKVRKALAEWQDHHAVLVPLAAPHLVDPDTRLSAGAAIRRVAPRAIGALADILLDPKMEFALRRRMGPLLAETRLQRAADVLVTALSDERLEVRYVASRALLTMTEGNTEVVLSRELVVKLVAEELGRVPADDEDKDDKDDDDPQASLFDAIESFRMSRRLEHIFNILALVLDREPLRLAFRALSLVDEKHRGTALEYIQTVLPQEIRDALWPLLAPENEPLPAPRDASELLGELARMLDREPT